MEQSKVLILLRAARDGSNVVITDADTWLLSLLAVRFRTFRSVKGSILLMRSQPNVELGSRARHAIKKILVGVLRRLHSQLVISALVAVNDASQPFVVLDPVAFSPSGKGREEWLSLHGLDRAKKWLVVLGEVSERKCIGLLLDALMTDAAVQAGWGLLVIGKPSQPMLAKRLTEVSREQPGRIVFRNAFLNDEEFDTWLSVADAMSVLYKNEGSSGVLLKCWAAGATVILGGSQSVLSAAESLDMKCHRVEDLSPEGILRAVLSVDEEFAVPVPNVTDWQGRSDQFARVLLGLG
jgi:hypothetical protein